jgi:three-Cys-motif partner protein
MLQRPTEAENLAHDPYMLQRQTQAKHDLLRHYLIRWARVLSYAGHTRLMFIDGFSFAGMYTSDEDGGSGGPGSPLIALQAFTGEDPPAAKGLFLFVDQNPSYTTELQRNIDAWPHKRSTDQWKCRAGDFADEVLPAVDTLEKQAAEARGHGAGSPAWTQTIIPAFFFVDPYGVAGFPMSLLGRVLRLPRTEVFINLMWVRTALNLHNPVAQDAELFTRMFGSDRWRDLLTLRGEELRRAFLDLYLERLRAPDGANARIVRSFEMCGSDGAVVYWMVFCTNHARGWEKMKDAMWKVDPGGRFQYKDTTHRDQPVLFEPQPQGFRLRRLLEQRYQAQAGIQVADALSFVVAETPFRAAHLRPVLKEMEREGKLTVRRPSGARAGTFTEEALLDFP